jgi:hypothetical protein
MPRVVDRSSETWAQLSQRALRNVVAAVTMVVKMAIGPAPQAAQRGTAALLLASMGLLAIVARGAALPSGVMLSLGVIGAVGLLAAGYAGTRLDALSRRLD